MIINNIPYYSAYSWFNPVLSTVHYYPEFDLFHTNTHLNSQGSIQHNTEHYLCSGQLECTQNRYNIQTAQKLQNDIVRRVLSILLSTPLCVVQMDTGIYCIQATTDRHKLLYFCTARKSQNILLSQVLSTQDVYYSYGRTWLSTIQKFLEKYHEYQ